MVKKGKKEEEEDMGSMNSNNWLSFPLSQDQSSLQANLHASQSHQFSLGLVNEPMDNPFQNQGMYMCVYINLFIPYVIWKHLLFAP